MVSICCGICLKLIDWYVIQQTASESDLDGLPESEGHLKRSIVTPAALAAAAAAVAASTMGTPSPASPSNASSGAVPKKDSNQAPTAAAKASRVASKTAAVVGGGVAAASTIAALASSWDSDSDQEADQEQHHTPESQRDEVGLEHFVIYYILV